MGTLANWIMRALGLGAAVDALDGETSKAYIGAVGMLLSGAATALGGLASLAAEIVPLHGAGDYLAFAQHLKADPAALAIIAGMALISKALEGIGQRHATAKLAAQIADAAPVPGVVKAIAAEPLVAGQVVAVAPAPPPATP